MQREYQDLANAIVVQAANDYRNALRGVGYYGKPPESIIKACERFFHSAWFRTLTKVDGEYLIEELKQEYKEQQRKEQLCT